MNHREERSPESATQVPVIDVRPLVTGQGDRSKVAEELKTACRQHGFFYVTSHGVPEALQRQLEDLSREFFAQDEDSKMQIRMSLGGKAWRGYFPVGEELTSGKPDLKEGLYFGIELPEKDQRVQQGLPLHGPNLFPPNLPAFRAVVLEYITLLTQLGYQLMEGIALSLGLEASYFAERYLHDPLTLFRIFHYPPVNTLPGSQSLWGVGEHTDYGVLTILKQDEIGGLQIKSQDQWINAPFIPGTFICNIGDMLDRMTAGYYRSTPHRVRNNSGKGRFSFPFFFDPDWNAKIEPIDLPHPGPGTDDPQERWDKMNLHEFAGSYGDYILSKVAKVFPQLRRDIDS